MLRNKRKLSLKTKRIRAVSLRTKETFLPMRRRRKRKRKQIRKRKKLPPLNNPTISLLLLTFQLKSLMLKLRPMRDSEY